MGALKHRILVVDDDHELRSLLQRYLGANGYEVRAVADTASMDRQLQREPWDALVLDLMMPDEDGLSACRRLRAASESIPIIILTAKGDPVDRIIGIEMGADDYLAKPFEPRELLARIGAVLRRTGPRSALASRTGPVRFGPFVLDAQARKLTRLDEVVELSSREFELLAALATNRGRPISRAHIIDAAFGRDADVTDRAVDVQVTRLRKAIEENPANPVWIRTVWGVGYMLARDDEK